MLFPVQARRLFPSCSVEEVPLITVTGFIGPATPPAADHEALRGFPWSSRREPPRFRTIRT